MFSPENQSLIIESQQQSSPNHNDDTNTNTEHKIPNRPNPFASDIRTVAARTSLNYNVNSVVERSQHSLSNRLGRP
jgi:hypothetical protein